MLKNVLLLLILLSAVLLAAQSTIDYTQTLPVDPDLKIGKLPNGITYYIKVNRKPEKRAELRLAVNIGSVQEDDDQQGLAHFTEHMAFNGTKHFKKSELVDYLNSIGMGYANGLNAATGIDQTVYELQIPTDNQEQFRKAFLILSDWAHGISFDIDELDKERGVIIEEWRGGQGADQRLYDKQRKVIFAGSKYAERMPIGKLEVLQNFKQETIKKFYSDWYRPDLQAVIAVGDFDALVVEQLIKDNFSSIPTKENPREAILYDVPDHLEGKAVIASDKEASGTIVQIDWKHARPINRNIGDYRRSLVVNLYTQMLNMRMQELTQQAEPPFYMAYNFFYNIVRSKSNYSLLAGVPEEGIVKGITALLTEAERVDRYGFAESELERAKQIALRNADKMLAERDKQESDKLVWRYVSNFSYGNPVMSIEQNVALNKLLYNDIQLADVNIIGKELITDKNMVISVSAPEKEGLILPKESDLLSLITQVKASEIAPYHDIVKDEALLSVNLKPMKIKSEKNYKKPGIKQWKMKNGITVLSKKTTFKNDEILLKAFSPGGTNQYSLEDLYEAREAADVITNSGINGFDATTLKKKLAGKIANVEPYIYGSEEGFNALCSKSDMETLFQLIYLYCTAPKLDSESYTSWYSRTKAWMENESLAPETVYNDSVYALTYDNHPRARNMKVADLDNLDKQRILDIYQDRFSDMSDFTFVFVGSFDEKELKKYCEKYLSNLPAKGRQDKIIDTGMRLAKGKKDIAVYNGQDEKSIVQFSLNGEINIDARTASEIRNLSYLLNEKLRENIRETRSGVYFVGAWDNLKKYPVSTYQISIYMACSPDRVTELSDAVISTLDSLKAGKFDAKYANVVKVTRQKKMETDLNDNRWWLDSIYNQVWNNFPINDLLYDKQAIESITLPELKKSAELYLNHDVNLVRGVLYPQSRAGNTQSTE